MSEAGPSSLRRMRRKTKRLTRIFGRDEGQGGEYGMVLPMDVVGTGVYDVAYTVPIYVGKGLQNLSLQVDTGSSDLWIASTSCTSSSCSSTDGRNYNPSGADSTGDSFSITYLEGNVTGPIVWDTVQIGNYSIDNQALSAATQVDAEPLASNFDGILGLALPSNSIIAQTIPPVTNNDPDGATFSSNLFGITPISQAPSAHFLSLVLSRPGSDRLPALLGIGHHPAAIIPDPSLVQYTELVNDNDGIALFWKVNVQAITVYVDSVPRPVAVGRSNQGGVYPTAVLDSGMPLILTTSVIADGIYGALGIGPASDGQYYVPCTTPLNMTFTLDGLGEFTIHPLDLTAEPPDNANSDSCVGLIQAADATLASVNSNIGDMILGVPFMRNVYTVLAYQVPDSNGNFAKDTDPDDANNAVHPRLGILGLTNATIALQEFNTVRVSHEPLPTTGASGASNTATSTGGKKMSIGVEVLIGLVSLLGACVILFAVRWWLTKRKWNRTAKAEAEGDKPGPNLYQLASMDDPSSASTLRSRSEDYTKKDKVDSGDSWASDRTHVDAAAAAEFGQRVSKVEEVHNPNDPWDPRNYSMAFRDSVYEPEEVTSPRSPEPAQLADRRPDHQRTTSELKNSAQSSLMLLMLHARDSSRSTDLTEFGVGSRSSMAGIGTAARGSMIDPAYRQSSVGSVLGGVLSSSPASATSPRRTSFSPRGPRPVSSRSTSEPWSPMSPTTPDVGQAL